MSSKKPLTEQDICRIHITPAIKKDLELLYRIDELNKKLLKTW